MNNTQLLLLKHNLNNINSGHNTVKIVNEQINQENLILSQTVKDPKVLDQMQNAWNNFVETGQIWALIIGIIVGYMFRSFTSY